MKFNFRQKKMSKLICDRQNVLDIGCSQMPNQFILNKNLIGFDVEPMQCMAPNYQMVIKGDVVNLTSLINEMKFDAILAGEIIEHLENPLQFLRDCYSILEEKGKLVISTPNPHSFFECILTLLLNKNIFYTKAHVCIYPQRWLIRMFELSGFTNVKIYGGGLTFPGLGDIPFFRTVGLYTIVEGTKP